MRAGIRGMGLAHGEDVSRTKGRTDEPGCTIPEQNEKGPSIKRPLVKE